MPLAATSAATVTPNILAILDSESPACTTYSCGTTVVVVAGAAVVGGSVASAVVVLLGLSSPPIIPHAGPTDAKLRATRTPAADRRRLTSMLTARSSLPPRPPSQRRRIFVGSAAHSASPRQPLACRPHDERWRPRHHLSGSPTPRRVAVHRRPWRGVGGLRVGRSSGPAAVPPSRRPRLRRHVRSPRAARGRRGLARRVMGPAGTR